MPQPASDATPAQQECAQTGHIDYDDYSRRAQRLRAQAIQQWAATLGRCLVHRYRTLAARFALREQLRLLDTAARKDLGLGEGDLLSIADGSFDADPTRRPRGRSPGPTPFTPICWLNGTLLPIAQARVSVCDHGLLYGDGVFEGIRFYHRRPFRLDAHLERLSRSAAAIRLDLPYDTEALTRAVQETIDAYQAPHGYLRLVVTRGEGALGLDPDSCQRPTVFIIANELVLAPPSTRNTGARLIIASTRRLPLDGLDPRIKSLNYLNHILARIEANNAGMDEAILLNAQGRVAEGTADNVFIVRNRRLITPPVIDGALDGITRNIVFELAAQRGIHCTELSLAPYDLYTADECFLTGTGAELIPVREIDGRALRFSPGPVYRELQAAFNRLTAGPSLSV